MRGKYTPFSLLRSVPCWFYFTSWFLFACLVFVFLGFCNPLLWPLSQIPSTSLAMKFQASLQGEIFEFITVFWLPHAPAPLRKTDFPSWHPTAPCILRPHSNLVYDCASSRLLSFSTALPPTTILRFFKGIAFHFLKIFLQSHELSSICFLAETPNCYLPYYCLYCLYFEF